MHSSKTAFAALFALSALASALRADGTLGLDDAVNHALEHNLGLKVQRYAPAIAADDIVIADSTFDAQLTAGAGVGGTRAPLTGVDSGTGSLSAGVSKKISTGATVNVQTELSHDSSHVGGDAAGVYASVTQPLLRGAWADVTLADLRKAKSRLTAAQLQLRSDTLDIVLEVESDYWNLSYADGNVALTQSSVDAAAKLVEEVKAKHAAGRASDVELLEAQASLAKKQNLLTQARQARTAAADALCVVMGSLLDEKGASSSTAVADLPADSSPAPDFDTAWQQILSEDISGPIQEETIRRADIDRIVARSNRRPQLDLTLSGGYDGAGISEGEARTGLYDHDGRSWNSSLAFSVPLGRRENLARSRQAGAVLEQAKIGLVQSRQELFRRARQAWRDVQMGLERCESAAAGVQFQEKAFEAARAKYSNGLITFRELLDAQSDCDTARQENIDARRDLALARATLARLDGSLAATLAPRDVPPASPAP